MRRRIPAGLAVCAIVALFAGWSRADTSESQKAEAQTHFQRGLELSAEEAWDAAYAEYAASRALYPTRAATKNAALCLRQLHRFDEALEMLESFLRDFPNLSDQDRAFAAKEMQHLRPFVGEIDVRSAEAGATVSVDGKERGTAPLPSPVRVSAGSHVVRVYRAGFAPFEERVAIAGKQVVVVEAKLQALGQSGRLHVGEEGGQTAAVVVDNVVVGQTPWDGLVSVGDHTVVLRGNENRGTQPAAAPVRLNELTSLTLRLETLDAEVRIDATPLGALVAVDGTSVGRGVWEGRLRAGDHQFEIGAEGFVPARRRVRLAAGKREVVTIQLERDLESPVWRASRPSRFFVDLRGAGALGAGLGGELSDACTGACSQSLTTGLLARLGAGYELGSGLGFGLDVGYASLKRTISGRPDALKPLPIGTSPANPGTSDDTLAMSGVLVGASTSLHRGAPLSWLLRLGAGAWLATVDDTRSGTFTTVRSLRPDGTPGAPVAYSVGPLRETLDARYAYLAPEARIGWRFGDHLEVSAGVELLLLIALSQPHWQSEAQPAQTGNCQTAAPAPDCVRDGLAAFDSAAAAARIIPLVSMGAAARYAF